MGSTLGIASIIDRATGHFSSRLDAVCDLMATLFAIGADRARFCMSGIMGYEGRGALLIEFKAVMRQAILLGKVA